MSKVHTDAPPIRSGWSRSTLVVASFATAIVATFATQLATLAFQVQAEGAASVQLAQVVEHNDADNITARVLMLEDILEVSTYAPMRTAPSLQDFVALSPVQIENIERVAFTVPTDWECQARVTGGVFPCPQGIPSVCRYYLSNLYTDQCVLRYCSKDGDGADLDHCCKYFVPDPTSTASSETSWLHTMPVNSQIDDDVDAGDSPYHDSYDTLTTGPKTVGVALADALALDPAVCNAENTLLTDNEWGARNWWDAEDASVSYINFKVVRFEMGEAMGLSLYSVQSDNLIISPDKKVFYKPITGEMAIEVNTELTFTPPEVTARRELETTTTMSSKKAQALLAAQEKTAQLNRFKGSCHPFHGCPSVIKSDVAAKLIERRALQPTTTPRQLEEQKRKLGFFSALMTSGNFMMMQAGAF